MCISLTRPRISELRAMKPNTSLWTVGISYTVILTRGFLFFFFQTERKKTEEILN